jgi:hypothetical protein
MAALSDFNGVIHYIFSGDWCGSPQKLSGGSLELLKFAAATIFFLEWESHLTRDYH